MGILVYTISRYYIIFSNIWYHYKYGKILIVSLQTGKKNIINNRNRFSYLIGLSSEAVYIILVIFIETDSQEVYILNKYSSYLKESLISTLKLFNML